MLSQDMMDIFLFFDMLVLCDIVVLQVHHCVTEYFDNHYHALQFYIHKISLMFVFI